MNGEYVECDQREVCIVCLAPIMPGELMKIVGPRSMFTGSGMHMECDPEYVEEDEVETDAGAWTSRPKPAR